MKRTIIAISLVLALVLAGCGKDETPATTNTVVPQRDIPTGNINYPGWEVGEGYDYSSSMTAVVAIDLTCTYPDLTPADWQINSGDMLGAFAGNECVGVTDPTDDLFFLYISSPSETNAKITLHYYSAQLQNIFQADTVLYFENGARIGSVADPLTPVFSEFKNEN